MIIVINRKIYSKVLRKLYNFTFRNRKELAITDTELKLMANAAIIGDNKIPNTGNKIPAAIGTPSTL